jgi:hypothetical protein
MCSGAPLVELDSHEKMSHLFRHSLAQGIRQWHGKQVAVPHVLDDPPRLSVILDEIQSEVLATQAH